MAISLFSLLLFAGGFGFALIQFLNPTPSSLPSLEPQTKAKIEFAGPLSIVALGDSLTRGVGDEEGIGYTGRVVELLRSEKKMEVHLTNLAVSGATSSDLLKQLHIPGMRYAISQADLILLTIGGNDLNPGFEKLGEIDLSKYVGNIQSFLKNGKEILTTLREINPEAPIYWLGLYNPIEDVSPESNGAVFAWNRGIEELTVAEKNTFFVPLFDLFHSRTKELLYTDHFHPNRLGYTAMAVRLYSNLVNSAFLEGGGDVRE